MGTITIRTAEDTSFVRTADTATEEMRMRYGEGELASSNRRILPVGDEGLQLFEVELPPGTRIQPHAHSSSEIIVVTGGEIIVGIQRCPLGTTVYVDADTLYSFRAGPDGCRFLNFRPTATVQYFTKQEHLARLRERRGDVPLDEGRPGSDNLG